MNEQELIDKMYDCLDYGDLNGFKKVVKQYLSICDETAASQGLATFLVTQYTAARADSIAKLMEIILQCNPNLGLIHYPENSFFKIAMISGSLDLLECLMEEVIEPHLESSSPEEYVEYYTRLLKTAAKLNTVFADQYQKIIKGIDFNGVFNTDERGICAIHKTDFEMMNDIVDRYNTIVGRRDIIKELMFRAEM